MKQLIPGKSALLVIDWAMKLLPRWYREDMTKFFGKRGLPWEITVAIMKTEDRSLTTRTFLHCFDQCKQDSNAFLAILKDTLERLKIEKPELNCVYLRADNGACYHSTQTLLSLPSIANAVGVQIKRFDFSDPQGGKADCDRKAASVKRHIKLYVAEKHNVKNGKQFVKAVESHGGIHGLSIHHGVLQPNEHPTPVKKKIEAISLLFNFQYEEDHLRAWKAFEIGEGKLVAKTSVNITNKFRFTEKFGTTQNVQWHEYAKSKEIAAKELSATDKEEDEAISQTMIGFEEEGNDDANELVKFSCPNDGCIREYTSQAYLEKHLIQGNHKYDVPKVNLIDFSKKMYKTLLDEKPENIFGPTASTPATVAPGDDPQASGWALKQKKEATRFSDNQIAFLKEKFQEGEETGDKYTPEQVAKLMRRTTSPQGEPLFEKEEFMTRNQIASYFSHLAASKRLANKSESDESEEEGEESDEEESESVWTAERDDIGEYEHRMMSSIRQNVNCRLNINQLSETLDMEPSTSRATATVPKRNSRQSKKRCAPPMEVSRRSKRFH